MIDVRELTDREEWLAVRPVLMQLWSDARRVDLDRETYLAELRALVDEEGYRLFGLQDDGVWVAVAGVFRRRNVWWGEYVFVCDLVTDSDRRSEGYGTAMLSFIEEWGAERGCERLVLSTAVERERAQSFYESFGFEHTSYLYQYRIEGD